MASTRKSRTRSKLDPQVGRIEQARQARAALLARHPRELLYAAATAYAAKGSSMGEILEALADADYAGDTTSLEKKGGPLAWARGRRDPRRARADAVRMLVSICRAHKANDVDDDAAVKEAADTIALLAATKLEPVYRDLGVLASRTPGTRAIYKRRMAVLDALLAMYRSSRTDEERLAVAVLRGLGLEDQDARNAIKVATKKL